MQQLIGQVLDRYQIQELLGQGGMGSVYRARDLTLQREVAVKIMHANLADQPEFKIRFLQEARAAANLNHEGIVKVFDFRDNGDLMYIVMEYIAGGNLKQMMQHMRDRQRWLLLADVAALVQQLALALNYAHRQGILHRDIKPANVMLTRDPADEQRLRPVIADMGLARLAKGDGLTQPGDPMGTPAYMSPEQAMGLPVGPQTDIYALGVVLYELAVGELPYAAKSLSEAIQIHTAGKLPTPPRRRRPDLPPTIDAVIMKALAPEAARRYATAREMADALAKVATSTAVSSLPPAARQGAITLATLYQEGMVANRTVTPVRRGEETEPPASNTSVVIQITEPGKGTQVVELQAGSIPVGRDPDNLIRLEDIRVSRHHARIDTSGAEQTVIDLNSQNGTYLGDSPLLPSVRELWRPGVVLRIGPYMLELKGSRRESSLPGNTYPTLELRNQEIAPVMEAELQIAGSQLRVEAGGETTLTVTVANRSPTVAHFQLALGGIPADWVAPVAPSYLMPGAQEQAAFTIRPPRAPESRAGSRDLQVYVRRKGADTALVTQRARLTIDAYYLVMLTLVPQHRRGAAPGMFDLRIANQGNSDVRLALSAESDIPSAVFTFDTPEAVVGAGATHTAQLQIRLEPASAVVAEQLVRFVARAQSIDAPGVNVTTPGNWVCMPVVTGFDAILFPTVRTSRDRGDFGLQLTNAGQATTTIRMTAVDEGDRCTFTFDPAQVILGGGQQSSVRLSVQPRQPQQGSASIQHRFTVTATNMEPPIVVRQVAGTWVQESPVAVAPLPAQQPPVTPAAEPRPAAIGFWFWLRWVVVSAFMWVMAMYLSPVLLTYSYVSTQSGLVNFLAFVGGIVGMVGGTLQWLMLRWRALGAGWWIPASIVAWAAGMVAPALVSQLLGSEPKPEAIALWPLLGVFVHGIVVSGILWLALRRYSVSFFWWVLMLPNVVLLVSVPMNLSDMSEIYNPLIQGSVYGVMTASILLRALRRSARKGMQPVAK